MFALSPSLVLSPFLVRMLTLGFGTWEGSESLIFNSPSHFYNVDRRLVQIYKIILMRVVHVLLKVSV